MSVFPMNAPRYAVYMMLDDPKADASTHGYTTAGWVSAPAAGKVIARIGPMLGLLPETDAAAAATEASLAIPLQPGRPPGAPLLAARPQAPAAPAAPAAQNRTARPAPAMPVSTPPARDLSRDVTMRMPVDVRQ
jgi:cell division protein FtsI (penicillin-binding protein 3)